MEKEEKYLQEKIDLVRAVVAGSILGMALFGKEEDVPILTNKAMQIIERDIRNIYKYAKRAKRV